MSPTKSTDFIIAGILRSNALLSVVIPTYNEAENIARMITDLSQELGTHRITNEIIVVDDDSPDLTWKRAEELTATHSPTASHTQKNRARIGKRGDTRLAAGNGRIPRAY